VSSTAILVLLIVSAIGELFGTVTVAISYARVHRLGLWLLAISGPEVRRHTAADLFKPADTTLATWDLEVALASTQRRWPGSLGHVGG
jgi:hypothetical protein